MMRNKIIASIGLSYITILLFCTPLSVIHAQTQPYKALSTIPGVTEAGKDANPVKLVTNIYGISIGIAAILAIGMIIWAGIQYATTEAITGKSEAKQHWQGALWGLLLLLSSYLILRTINLSLVEQDLSLGTPVAGCANPPCTESEDAALTETRKVLAARKVAETAALATANEKLLEKERELVNAIETEKPAAELERLEAEIAALKNTSTVAQQTLLKTTNYTALASSASHEMSAFEAAKKTASVQELTAASTAFAQMARDRITAAANAKYASSEIKVFTPQEIDVMNVEFGKQIVYMNTYVEWARKVNTAVENGSSIPSDEPPVRPAFNLIPAPAPSK